jgi:hypothetical protein
MFSPCGGKFLTARKLPGVRPATAGSLIKGGPREAERGADRGVNPERTAGSTLKMAVADWLRAAGVRPCTARHAS